MSIDPDQFHAALKTGDIDAAFALLEAAPELPARELPRCKPDDLRPALDDATARLELVAGLLSPSTNVRKWVKGRARYLTGPAAADLLALILSTWEPFEAADEGAIAGSWDGLTSPVGAHIRRRGLPTSRQKRGDYYSPAMRYVTDALQAATEALARADPSKVFQFKEFVEAKGRSAVDRSDPIAPHSTGGLDQLLWAFNNAMNKGLSRASQAKGDVLAAAEAWIDGRALSDDDPVLAPWLDEALTNADLRTRSRRLRWDVPDLLTALEPEDRTRLYHRASAICRELAEGPEKRWWLNRLERLRRRFPAELRDVGADLESLKVRCTDAREAARRGAIVGSVPGMKAVLEQQVRELEAEIAKLERQIAGEMEEASATDGPALDLVMEALEDLADALGLKELQQQLQADAGIPDWDDDDDAAAPLRDDRLADAIRGLHQLVLAASDDGDLASRHLGEAALEDYAAAPALLDALRIARTRVLAASHKQFPHADVSDPTQRPGRTMSLTLTLRGALALLPRSLWKDFGAWFAVEAVEANAGWSHFNDARVGAAVLQRPMTDPDIAKAWIRSLDLARFDAVRQAVLAGLIGAGGDAREAALELIRELPNPEREVRAEENGQPPVWDAAAWRAWNEGDTEVLCAMLETVQLPYYRADGTGAEAIIPPITAAAWLPSNQRYRKPRPVSGGAPLKDVIARIVAERPERLELIAEAALRSAEHSWLARRTLTLLGRTKGTDKVG